MSCLICRNLERAYEVALSEYRKACSSESYRISTLFAAQKNVDMERAKYELEEHRRRCHSVAQVSAFLPERQTPKNSREVAA
jgi:hypothetical protein